MSAVSHRFASETVRLRGIGKRFPSRHRAILTGVDLSVRAGEILGVIGANGAGKTTLLEILATVQRPTSGDGVVGGYDLLADAAAIKPLIGYCPASADSFYPRLTCGANLSFFAALYGMNARTARARVHEALALVGASDLHDLPFQRCSTGMKHKLAMARALVGDPAILLLDEPTRSLDPRSKQHVRARLRHTMADALRKTIVLVTHDLEEAREVCDRVALLESGTIAGLWPATRLPADVSTPTSLEGSRAADRMEA